MSSAVEAAEESGNILALLVILNCHVSDLDACEEELSAMYRVLSSKDELDLGEGTKSLVDTLVLALRKHRKEPSLVEVALSCVRECAHKSELIQSMLCVPDTVELIIRVMGMHTEGEETIQEQGCLVITALATDSEENVALLRSHHAEKAVDQAARLITNERNKNYAKEAKRALTLV
mmetsp:Transcript_6531/g.10671  ORF Transcript_6531/g.10671 Transcript_6531/m.10671 type:complete len:177 (-) Transcript_6531:109-639(-)|eukprot:CAMPEP_0114413338 /NCGR_PEP_ID=MMETSP0103-20121206/805_1 /TAXON_ID=37642 ORGANISM="Paraphysomonas imperforata, Strain PA2" /NCGR_SAMPLE_ID=MMETSP0103 /ASSEMBLY_ACC=CAM_ASM_000201 /LENGTH=176 /DNA_ID=CAMNT_0001581413 /DNA_START=25 /DNA_END=555 /DNA_ORIENTATION=+